MSTIRVNAIQHTTANSGNMILHANGNVSMTTSNTTLFIGNTAISNAGISVGGTTVSAFGGMKNRLINGNHKVDQRNSYASVNFQQGYVYPCDRWRMFKDSTTVANGTVQVVSDAPTGFANSVRVTITTTQTSPVGSSNLISMLEQAVEGHNISDLNWGTANAAPVTLSFWVKSSVTGTYTVTLNRFSTDYTYPTTYLVNSSNTWEYKSISIPGPTVGSWDSTNGPGVYVIYNMFCSAANTTSSSDAWVQGRYFSVSGSTNLAATNGATWQIAGVQLEKGSQATAFEFRPYGTELALCQRYCYTTTSDNSAVAGNSFWGQAVFTGAGGGVASIPFPVKMRVSPTALAYTGSLSNYYLWIANGGAYQVATALSYNAVTCTTMALVNFSIASGGTAGQVGYILGDNSGAARFIFSAEL